MYRVETLSDHHQRSSFACGIEALDRYIQSQAGQDSRRNIAAPFVLLHPGSQAIAGFYTLSNTAIEVGRFPAEVARKLPKYPLVPATLLGRLAVGQQCRGQGLGEFLLMDALHRSLEASRQVASFAVVVVAKDEAAAAFYKHYGFTAFADSPRQLFLAMKTVARLSP
jgi:GNAT superfamily N-acetyltransferase